MTASAGAKTKTKRDTATVAEIGRIYYQRHPKDIIFTRGRWHEYGGGIWVPANDLVIRWQLWKLLEEIDTRGMGKPTLHKIRSVEDYLQSRYFVPEERIDAHEHLICLQNGVYGLAAQELVPHDPDYYLTTGLPFEYDADAECSTWQMYLMTTLVKPRSHEPDPELINFVQEAMGYSLTTDIRFHCMFWCVGSGANGKGVLFHVLERLGGNGAIPLNVGLLRREQYQLATLAGKRMALCTESGATENLVEDALIKALVSGDTMNVRQIRREPFVLHPTVKLWWSMNTLPAVADTSEGFWRRVRLIPFNRYFEPDERILDLKTRLHSELPGIFRWAMEGLARLRERGHFQIPQQVRDKTERYRRESNNVRLFVDSQCKEAPNLSTQASTIYGAYKSWCQQNTYHPYSARNFKREMERLGFYADRRSQGVYYEGITMKPQRGMP